MFVIVLHTSWLLMNVSAVVDVRLCRSCESSNDLLPQQSTADAVYDSRVPQCCLQVGCNDDHDDVKTVL